MSYAPLDRAALEARYGTPAPASLVKVADRITPPYAALIAASPFLVLATAGPGGLDASPRGDAAGALATVEDPRTLVLPDRAGNNRMDSLRNVLDDPRVALLFLIPGAGTTLRVNGTAVVTADEGLLARHAVGGKAPRSALVIAVAEVYFQCARAVVRSGLWDGRPAPARLPTPGAILEAMSAAAIPGEAYDRDWPARAAATLW